MRECITHHYACDCREEAIRKFIVELLAYLQQDMPLAKHTELWETAVTLGYVKPFALAVKRDNSSCPRNRFNLQPSDSLRL